MLVLFPEKKVNISLSNIFSASSAMIEDGVLLDAWPVSTLQKLDRLPNIRVRRGGKMDRIEFGRYLATRRKELGINSLEQMSTLSGISRSMLQRLESGGTPRPSAQMLASIARAYKIRKEVAEEVFLKGIEEENGECERLDRILKRIAADKSFALKDYAAKSFSECKRMGKQTKIFIIKAYEMIQEISFSKSSSPETNHSSPYSSRKKS